MKGKVQVTQRRKKGTEQVQSSNRRIMLRKSQNLQAVIKLERCCSPTTSISETSGGNINVQIRNEMVTQEEPNIAQTKLKNIARTKSKNLKRIVNTARSNDLGRKAKVAKIERNVTQAKSKNMAKIKRKDQKSKEKVAKKEKKKRARPENPLCCKFCGKQFKNKSLVERHSVVHTGVKKFRCFGCKRPFSRKDHMLLHFRKTCKLRAAQS